MKNLFKSIDHSDIHADKEGRAADIRTRDEVIAATRTIDIEQKLKNAEEKRARAAAETVQQLAAVNKDKLRRGAESIQAYNQSLKEAKAATQRKIELAQERREQKVHDKIFASTTASAKKEARKKELLALEEAELKVKEKAMHVRVIDANLRKEQQLLEKSSSLNERFEQMKKQSSRAMKMELQEASVLGKEIDLKLKLASARKEQLDRSRQYELHERNEKKVSNDAVIDGLNSNSLSISPILIE